MTPIDTVRSTYVLKHPRRYRFRLAWKRRSTHRSPCPVSSEVRRPPWWPPV